MKREDIIGNEEIRKYLEECIQQNKISQSYLFVGTEGIGKLLIAKQFAKRILCFDSQKDEEEKCKSCHCFEGGNHPDYLLVNEHGQTIKIEQIREITSKIIQQPIISQKKVYIINDCDKMTKEAQNCFLKTLEEPPQFAVIILISSNENAILTTIKSRCMTIKFKNIANELLQKYAIEQLEYNTVTENLLQSFQGSIGKAIEQKNNQEKFEKIENIIHNFATKDVIYIMNEAKILYDKENIDKILEYMMISMYAKKDENPNYIKCIDKISDCLARLKRNCNFDMCLDTLFFEMSEILQNA